MPKVVNKIVRPAQSNRSPRQENRASALSYDVEDLNEEIQLENIAAPFSFPGHLPFPIPKNSGRKISRIPYSAGTKEVPQADQSKSKENLKIFELLMYAAVEKMEIQSAASGVVFAPRTGPNTPNDPDRLIAQFGEMIQAGCYPKLTQATKEIVYINKQRCHRLLNLKMQ